MEFIAIYIYDIVYIVLLCIYISKLVISDNVKKKKLETLIVIDIYTFIFIYVFKLIVKIACIRV